MRTQARGARVARLLIVTVLALVPGAATALIPSRAEALPRLSISGDEILAGGRPFISFGYYYGGDFGRPARTIAYFRDPTRARFRALRETIAEARRYYGANTVRIFLQFPDFMPRRDERIDERAVSAVRRLLHASERLGVYLVLTGNVTLEPARARPWYDRESDPERWRTQARFWFQLARELRGETGVAWYELTNEPAVSRTPVDSWYAGELGGFTWAQYVVKDTGGERPFDVSAAWTERLSRAVGRGDPRALVSAGLFPYAGATAPFGPAAVRDPLDLAAIHTYPESGHIDEMLGDVRAWAEQTGKPVVLGEVAPLAATPRETAGFMRDARPWVDGYIGHYHGLSPREAQPDTEAAQWWRDELAMFGRVRPDVCDGLCRVRARGG